mgnify:CR=1 FL=1
MNLRKWIPIGLSACLVWLTPAVSQVPHVVMSDTNPTALHWGMDHSSLQTQTPETVLNISATDQLAERNFIHVAEHMTDNNNATAWCAKGDARGARIFVNFDKLPAGMSLTPGFAYPSLWSTNKRIVKFRITYGANFGPPGPDFPPFSYDYQVNRQQLSSSRPSVHYFDFRDHFTNNHIASSFTLLIIEILETEGPGDTCISEMRFFKW